MICENMGFCIIDIDSILYIYVNVIKLSVFLIYVYFFYIRLNLVKFFWFVY